MFLDEVEDEEAEEVADDEASVAAFMEDFMDDDEVAALEAALLDVVEFEQQADLQAKDELE